MQSLIVEQEKGGPGKKTHGVLVEVEYGGAEELLPLGEDLRRRRAGVGRRRVVERRHSGHLRFMEGGSRLREAPAAKARRQEDPLRGSDPSLHLLGVDFFSTGREWGLGGCGKFKLRFR